VTLANPGRAGEKSRRPRAPSAAAVEMKRAYARQGAIGLALAVLVMGGWLAGHIFGVFFLRLAPPDIYAAPLVIALQTWLDVGLFIIAHDCMHGSLAPFRPKINLWVGRVALGLYAAFSFDRLLPKHHDHHRHSGTPDDPDFDADHPDRFWPWFLRFMRTYFGWREFAILTVVLAIYILVIGAPVVNVLLFWALPALLSALQLFYFGTYLPHRHGEPDFADAHNARSNEFGYALSLLTCFHFGYHHEHHEAPFVPWWRLPKYRRQNTAGHG
jgi:beta-carotene/zeaxanthin 4-ketolase